MKKLLIGVGVLVVFAGAYYAAMPAKFELTRTRKMEGATPQQVRSAILRVDKDETYKEMKLTFKENGDAIDIDVFSTGAFGDGHSTNHVVVKPGPEVVWTYGVSLDGMRRWLYPIANLEGRTGPGLDRLLERLDKGIPRAATVTLVGHSRFSESSLRQVLAAIQCDAIHAIESTITAALKDATPACGTLDDFAGTLEHLYMSVGYIRAKVTPTPPSTLTITEGPAFTIGKVTPKDALKPGEPFTQARVQEATQALTAKNPGKTVTALTDIGETTVDVTFQIE